MASSQESFSMADAVWLQHEGRRAEAEAAFRQIIAAEPGNAQACQLLGTMLHEAGRTEEAINWLRRAIELKPTSAGLRCNLAAVAIGMQSKAG